MGSAITFRDKITNKNCQNVEDLSGPLCCNQCFNHLSHQEQEEEEDEDFYFHFDCNCEDREEHGQTLFLPGFEDQDQETGEEDEEEESTEESLVVGSREQVSTNKGQSYSSYNFQSSSNSPSDRLTSTTESKSGPGGVSFSTESPNSATTNTKIVTGLPGCVALSSGSIPSSSLEVEPRGRIATLLTSLRETIMGRRCLCDTIKPILKLSQLLGVLPLRLYHKKSDQGETTGLCELNFRWRSIAQFFNTSLIIFFILISPFAHSEIRDRMSNVFSGTDLYAFTLQTVAMVLETTILLTVGRLYKGKFSKGWSSLNEVFHAICDSADDLKQIKLGSYITALIIMMEGVGFFLFMYWTSHRAIGVYQSCSALLIGTFVISLTLIIPYIMSTLFLFICLLIRSHFLKISDMLRTVVSKHNSPKLSAKIDSLRVLHEQLCQSVTYFEDFFGFQVLLTLCTCCFTVTVGAYACILQGEGMSSPQGKELAGAWGMQLYCAAIFILLILISGQLVTNAAASPGPVLNAIPLSELDEKSQTQVTAFLNKISAFPTKMSAVKITTISTTFLASAATNITTYLLVLMQFKLSFEKDRFEEDPENFTNSIPGAGFEMDPSTEPIFYNVTVPESLAAFLTESI